MQSRNREKNFFSYIFFADLKENKRVMCVVMFSLTVCLACTRRDMQKDTETRKVWRGKRESKGMFVCEIGRENENENIRIR